MKKVLIVFGLFLLMASFVQAIQIDGEEVDINSIDCSYLESYESEASSEQIPSQIPFQNEVLNIYLEENFFIGLTVEEGFLTDLSCVEYLENTYDLKVKDVEMLISELQEENADPMAVVLDNLDNGNVEITGKTFGKKVKWFFVNLGLKVFSWFS